MVKGTSITIKCSATLQNEATTLVWQRTTSSETMTLKGHAEETKTAVDEDTIALSSTLKMTAFEIADYTCSLSDKPEISAVLTVNVFGKDQALTVLYA